ncbi:MAG TPA: hypothetical protein VF862_04160 [Gemmatimonadales bacterium]
MTTRMRFTRTGLALAAAILLGAGCSTDELLDVDNPDVIDPGKLGTAQGANALYAGAIGDFALAHDGGQGPLGLFGGVVMTGGLFSDEFRFGGTPPEVRQLDLRDVQKENSFFRDTYLAMHRSRESAERAAVALAKINATDKRVGETYGLAGLMTAIIGEHFCSGTPFSSTLGGTIEYGDPLPTDQIMDLALAKLQAGQAATGGDPTVTSLLAVVRGRALLNKAQYAQAATAVAAVPTSFTYTANHSAADARTQNMMKAFIFDFDYLSVSDGEGGNGLNFASANDPRLVVDNPPPGVSRFDGETPHFRFLKYNSFDAPVVVASGVEARLIEAEAALRANDVNGWLGKLNAARLFYQMSPVADPGNANARVDLMFRERAFSLFGTGHRVGDMRRLVRQYNRPANTVIPTGAYHKDNLIRGADQSFVVPASEENNPKFQSSACNKLGS